MVLYLFGCRNVSASYCSRMEFMFVSEIYESAEGEGRKYIAECITDLVRMYRNYRVRGTELWGCWRRPCYCIRSDL